MSISATLRRVRRALPVLVAFAAVSTLTGQEQAPPAGKVSLAHGQVGADAPRGDACGLGPGNCGNMTSHGGSVQHVQKVYNIFWDPGGTGYTASYRSTINQFVADMSGSSYYGIASQYGDGSGNISTSVVFAGTFWDTDPTNPIPSDFFTDYSTRTYPYLRAEVERARAANGWTSDTNSYFQVFTPSGYGVGQSFCGFHTYGTSPTYTFGLILYPWSNGSGSCFPGSPYPHDAFTDAAISVTAHEILETVTDPYFDGWYYSAAGIGGEIGDLCAWTFGSRAGDGSNLTMNGRHYLAQMEWSNAISDCALSYAAVTPPPGAPTGLALSRTGATAALATWNAVSGATSYSVKVRFSSGGPDLLLGTLTTTAVTISGFTPGFTYYFVVSASNSGGESPDSAEVAFMIPITRTRLDWDLDGRAELAVWRATTGTWYWSTSGTGYTSGGSKAFGSSGLGDQPFVGDVDGDARADLLVWRSTTGTWYWLTSSSGYTDGSSKAFGSAGLGDQPFVGDFDGDGKVDLAVWRASNGTWYWVTSSSNYTSGGSKAWGSLGLGDVPMLADLDGDGKSDPIVWRPSTGWWYWTTSTSNYVGGGSKQFGSNALGDQPLTGDIDGDGKSELIVWRASNGTFYWSTSTTNYTSGDSRAWGSNALGDVPRLRDIDGDGKVDLVVWRTSTGSWYWLTSSSGYSPGGAGSKAFGSSGLGDAVVR